MFAKSSENLVVFRSNLSVGDPSVAAMLAELGGTFSNFRFFIAQGAEAAKVAEFLDRTFSEPFVNVAILNFTGLYWYDTAAYVGPAEKAAFDGTIWTARLRALLTDIDRGVVSKVYRSEPPPPPGGLVPELVGSNFEAAVREAKEDLVVFFFQYPCDECHRVERKLRRFAECLRAANNSDYAIRMIHIGLNQIPGGFPVSEAPAIAIYPAERKEEVRLLPYESYRLIVWFTAKYGARPHGIPANVTGTALIARSISRAEKLAGQTKPDVAARLRETIRDLTAEAAKGSDPRADAL